MAGQEESTTERIAIDEAAEDFSAKEALGEVYTALIGKRIVIQEKSPVCVVGLFTRYTNGFMRLEKAVIQARSGIATRSIPVLWVNPRAIVHVHEEATAQKIE